MAALTNAAELDSKSLSPRFRVGGQLSIGGITFRPNPRISNTDANILITLSVISVATFSLYVFRNRLQRLLPRWLQPFAREEGHASNKRKAWTHWTLILAFISISGFILSVVPICLAPNERRGILDIVPWMSILFMTALDRPTSTPRILLLQYFLVFSSGMAIYSAQFLDHHLRSIDPFRVARLALSLFGIISIGSMPLRNPAWDAEDIGNPKLPPSHHVRSPEDNLTLFTFWAMTWVYPLARLCRKKEITVEDVWQLPHDFQHTRLYLAFRELQGKLLPCLIEANGLDLSIATTLAIVEKLAEVSNIRLTSRLYNALDNGNPTEANFWCAVMLCVDFMRQVSKTTSSWYSRKAYERSRGETFIALFGKLLTRAVPGSDVTEKGPEEDSVGTLTRPNNTLRRGWLSCCCGRKHRVKSTPAQATPASNAKVVNLVRGDTYEISQRFWDFPKLMSQPIKVIVTIYYLIDIMGWPSCVGLGLMILFLTSNSLLVRKVVQLERSRTAHSDKRAQAVAHFVEASRPLKLNGWTSSWSARIFKFRTMEMLKRLQIARVTAAISTTNVAGGSAYPFASICLYTLILRQGLPNDVIWPSLQLFNQLEASLKEAFDLITAYWKAIIPVERVNKYMEEPDRDEDSLGTTDASDIEFHGASFAWPSTNHLVLSQLNLKFGKGLTIIRGKVGSGKSSLLLAALNEMELHGGDLLRPDEPVGYAQQLPWLQNKTIRENIVFHHGFDAARYRQVLHACALGPDLAAFPDGDLTKLEEGGVGLSGGQKARVALARAVYSPCRILLLDDPLAPLDHDTASNIVRRFLQGPLARERTIVMVTHRDDLVLRIANQVIDMDDGTARRLSQSEIKNELEHPYHATSQDTIVEELEPTHETHEEEEEDLQEAPEEPSETGSVPLTVYLNYMRAGGLYMWAFLALFYGISRYCDVSEASLLESWGNETAKDRVISTRGYWSLPNPQKFPQIWLAVFGGLALGQTISYGIAQLLLAKISIDAAQGIFKAAIGRVSKATFRYHDTTPTGQLKNRLVSDMGMVDGGILAPLEGFVYNFIALVLSIVGIATHQPMLLIILGAVAVLFVYFFRIYVPVSRSLRRMEMRYLTPIIANIGVMQDGLVTIRALRVEGRFQDRHLDAVDDFQKQDHFFWSMAFWLDFRLSISSACTRAALIIFMIWRGTPASAIGFVLTQTSISMASIQQLCEKFAQLQLDAVSLERVGMLDKIPEEPNGDEEPPADWPRPCDDVKFESMSFKYAEGLPNVLKKVTFEIPGGSTCAVLGRTGSGKSTIANALLVTETASEGTVRIGGMDLAKVNRTALRNRVTFIQQDPTLFPGTLRDNIDPEGKFSDEECENAIQNVLGKEWGLASQIDAGGKNLSQGQRQLVGIGRAVLRKSGLVILDEATASIDRGTAATVQKVLREELSKSTVITIAHRLEAVEDANWCLRLEKGQVLDCGPAKDLGKKAKEEES
ncbi:ABC transporter [Metarhizium robertsii]|uniref:Multidrug-resistance associated protein n=2 Tax=Metarhizium robertsii TaxID=568076 RepID=E9F4I7_METRA|nr:multidrug-resistance associated protein [Metarhizium robertsii ARSEF 23]EFY97544.1 multidrug-resistance associated protein [Metarhizium robertsii ARSEF 23]EXU99633.1 ABC transporter [Metarhizium robertsii]